LYDFGLRWYAPETCKWISRDPIAERGGFNLYALCNGDPVNGTDVLGCDDEPGGGSDYPELDGKFWNWVEAKVFSRPPENAPPPLELSIWQELTPFMGSGKHFKNSWQRNNTYGVLFYGGMFVSDAFLAKAIYKGSAIGGRSF